ncbi:MAG: hypothetical protein HY898_27870 [Deltaproteobacteria bacterium]|nr:hypothetical protein [Deltaproteobacteria bacterium]
MTNSDDWVRSKQGVLLPRRGLVQGAAALAVLSVLPREAEAAVPWLALGRFVAAAAISWGIGKVLDHFWESAMSPRAAGIKRYIGDSARFVTTTSATTGGVEGRFRDSLLEAKADNAVNYYIVPLGLIRAMEIVGREEASPSTAFAHWGPPTSHLVYNALPLAGGGVLTGLWWGRNRQGRHRFVVVRTTRSGSAGYIPCLGDYALKAERVVRDRQIALAGPRLRRLIEDPTAHVYDSADDAPAHA